jgi:hypothetical protein
MIYDEQVCYKTQELFFLIEEDCSKVWMGNHDARYGNQHLTTEYSVVHNSCKFPAVAQQENVPESILHQEDEVRLKKRVRKPGKEMQSIQSK